MIFALLKKEKEEEARNQLLQLFYDIADHLQQNENYALYLKYEEKLLEIFDLIMDIKNFISGEIEQFV